MESTPRTAARTAFDMLRLGLYDLVRIGRTTFRLSIAFVLAASLDAYCASSGGFHQLLRFDHGLVAPALAEDDKDDKDEAAKKAAEREREAAKKAAEREREAAKKAAEREKEAAKRAAEQEFKAAKKALEASGASEEEKKALESEYEDSKKKLKARYGRYDDRIPDTLIGVFRKLLARRGKKSGESENSRKSKSRPKGDDQRADKSENSRKSKSRPKGDDQRADESENSRKSKSRLKGDDRKKSERSEHAKSTPKRRTVGPDSLPRLDFKRNEVLAINLSSSGLSKARKLGFGVTKSDNFSSISGKVTRLTVPRGLDTSKALGLLKRKLPSDAFALNKVYSVYRTAREKNESEIRSGKTEDGQIDGIRKRKAGRGRDACKSDHCFGRSIIGWQSKHMACSKGIRVGVIDTPVDHDHPTFAGQEIKFGRFIPEDRIASSSNHGTGVVALLAGSPNSGTPGLIPYAEIYAASIFYADKQGFPVTDTLTLFRALDWMEAWNVNLINMSFTGPKDQLLEQAIRRMAAKGVIFVAAAGNDGPTAPPSYPGAYSDVIAVTAVNKNLLTYRYANRGSYIDVAAPGVDIWTAFEGRNEGYQSGTSFAVPHVTASLASIYWNLPSARRGRDWIGALPVRDLGVTGPDPIYGRGLLLAPQRCGAQDFRSKPIASAISGSPVGWSARRRLHEPEASSLNFQNVTIQTKRR